MPGFDERGLLGLAFHPQYAANGRFFVYYSAPLRAGAPAGFDHTSHISEFRVSPPIRTAPTPRRSGSCCRSTSRSSTTTPARCVRPGRWDLYISIGDGGGANDVGLGHVADWYADNAGGNGQDVTQNLLGNILRIDVDAGIPYGIPPDNPFVGHGRARRDLGVRPPQPVPHVLRPGREPRAASSPTSDRTAGRRSASSVAGGNYGWNVKEATHCFDAESPNQEPAEVPGRRRRRASASGRSADRPDHRVPAVSARRPRGRRRRRLHLPRLGVAPVPRPLRLRRLEPRLRPARRVAVRGQPAQARAVGDARAAHRDQPDRPAGSAPARLR